MLLNCSYLTGLLTSTYVLLSNNVQAQSEEMRRIESKLVGVLNDELDNDLERRKKKEAYRAPIFSTKILLYVIDGKPIWTDIVPLINPADIAQITTLKDSAAAYLYGSKGADGAIIITTKRFPAKHINRLFTKKGHLN